jgi:hypothetical protein
LQKIHIKTEFEKDIVLARIEAELAPNKLFDLQSRLEGKANSNRIIVSYRSSVLFFRQLKIATFRGRVIKLDAVSMIEGNIEPEIVYSATIGLTILVILISIASSIVSANYFDALSMVGGSAIFYLIIQWYYKSMYRHIIDSLCKAAKTTH